MCLLIPCFVQLFSNLLCAFRELLNGNCIMVYLCQLSALLGSIRVFLVEFIQRQNMLLIKSAEV